MLHLEIVQERLEREFTLSLIGTIPNRALKCDHSGGRDAEVENPPSCRPSTD